jgi:hypothetical protein
MELKGVVDVRYSYDDNDGHSTYYLNRFEPDIMGCGEDETEK